jgi:hypothetical protein
MAMINKQQTFDGVPAREVRAPLLKATLQFVRAARRCTGVVRIALIGSLTTSKATPKDTDLLVTIEYPMDLAELARVGRRLQGGLQSRNLGGDIFLADETGTYLGRACTYRECRPRVACRARHCGRNPHLNDDLHVVTLNCDLVANPPVVLWPRVVRNTRVPTDVETLLLDKIEDRMACGKPSEDT